MMLMILHMLVFWYMAKVSRNSLTKQAVQIPLSIKIEYFEA